MAAVQKVPTAVTVRNAETATAICLNALSVMKQREKPVSATTAKHILNACRQIAADTIWVLFRKIVMIFRLAAAVMLLPTNATTANIAKKVKLDLFVMTLIQY